MTSYEWLCWEGDDPAELVRWLNGRTSAGYELRSHQVVRSSSRRAPGEPGRVLRGECVRHVLLVCRTVRGPDAEPPPGGRP
jgi:hypothetical protein